ncbi:anchored repeat ABC transporter, substrate-binding protein [Brevibacterium sp. Marseille-P9724]|uniref:anchored repeat ABC transporter, substrate-binding protein n=1 Tax=Brevibacterium sp. Marseille-P9724 TaxID=2614125 RepID=UPI00125EF65C|nr:anchored repeat ABC transporter, substrate-binding protein [Brevibacterium sp. Marseille-P9724]
MKVRRLLRVAAASAAALALTGCATGLPSSTEQLRVVATTGIIADLASHVAGDAAQVQPLVPKGADPHSYEPTLRDVRSIVYADVALTNYQMLEEHRLITTVDANLPKTSINAAVAESAVKHGANVIPLVEDVHLDTVWLGLRVHGTADSRGADRSSEVRLRMTGASVPEGASAHTFLTRSLGQTDVLFDTTDGFGPEDLVSLPPAAHTHVSWAFSKPGVYRLRFSAGLATRAEDSREQQLASGDFAVVVGKDPATIPEMKGRRVVDAGHADITVDADAGRFALAVDKKGGGLEYLDPAETAVSVTNSAWRDIPRGASFLGPAGTPTYLLPQAVLGKHVHGEIDPHMWLSADNAIAYVKVIRDVFSRADPANAETYRANAAKYIDQLDQLDAEVRREIDAIPKHRRHIVTAHDAYRYFADAYGLSIAGFASPYPGAEPSAADRRRLGDTIRNLDIPAVFLEPMGRSPALTDAAAAEGAEVCTLYSDTFDNHVSSYIELMRTNARTLKGCLAP